MTKILSRNEIDKLLGVEEKKRALTSSEIKLLKSELKKFEKKHKMVKNTILERDIAIIADQLGFGNCRVLNKDGLVFKR